MGNRPLGGRTRNTNGTIIAVLEDGRGPKGQEGGDQEGLGTQRAPLQRDNSTETSTSATGSSVTEVPNTSLRPRHLGRAFQPMMCHCLTQQGLYYKLIHTRLVSLPEWEDYKVYACSIQDDQSGYFFTDPYTKKLVQFPGCHFPTYQSQTTVNFILYNSSGCTIAPLKLTVLSLNFSDLKNWALTVDTDNAHGDTDMYDVVFKNYNCCPSDLPTLKCTLKCTPTDSQCAFTLTQTTPDGQEYTFIAMPDAILGHHCSVIKAVPSTSGAASQPALLTFQKPIKF